jgi:hypothetical protein
MMPASHGALAGVDALVVVLRVAVPGTRNRADAAAGVLRMLVEGRLPWCWGKVAKVIVAVVVRMPCWSECLVQVAAVDAKAPL